MLTSTPSNIASTIRPNTHNITAYSSEPEAIRDFIVISLIGTRWSKARDVLHSSDVLRRSKSVLCHYFSKCFDVINSRDV